MPRKEADLPTDDGVITAEFVDDGFNLLSVRLGCDAMRTTQAQSKFVAHHCSLLLSAWKGTWKLSAVLLAAFLLMKLLLCIRAIKSLFTGGRKSK